MCLVGMWDGRTETDDGRLGDTTAGLVAVYYCLRGKCPFSRARKTEEDDYHLSRSIVLLSQLGCQPVHIEKERKRHEF